ALEETAFLMNLLIHIQHPILVAAAITSSNQIPSHRLYNFISPITLPSSSHPNHKPLILLFNHHIHTPPNLTNTHTSNINTFQTPNHPPLPLLTNNPLQFYHHPYT
ncbi:asparaginase domain-containing protein, partial [Staphylococcus epidermidis]|uniref:asparaginase domain-containing protein n=1 Tax=Staphylococcus epidermidis TaxID=1282 RepID=UPI0016429458